MIVKSWNHKRPRTAKAVLRKKNKAGCKILPDFRQHCKAPVIKQSGPHTKAGTWTSGAEQKPRNKPTRLWPVNLRHSRQEHTMGKAQVLQQVALGNATAACEPVKPGHPHTTHKNKLRVAWDLNTRHDTIKPWKEKTGKTFSDINHSNVFLGQSPKAIKIKAKINKWDIIKFISFCTAKEMINKMKWPSSD